MRQNLQSVSIVVIMGFENIPIRLVNKDFIKIVMCQIARGTGEWTLQMDWISWISKKVKGLLSIGIGPIATTTFIVFWDFLMFYQIFLLPQWNDARLLLINMVNTSCLTSCRTT